MHTPPYLGWGGLTPGGGPAEDQWLALQALFSKYNTQLHEVIYANAYRGTCKRYSKVTVIILIEQYYM